jgi:streptogramin lyase
MRTGHLTITAKRAGAVVAVVAGLFGAGGGAAHAAIDCNVPGTCRAEPFFPDAEVNALAVGNLGSTGAPEDDLQAALQDLKDAGGDTDAADKARARALAIIEGRPNPQHPLVTGDEQFLDDKAYLGIPLLNTSAKVKYVAAGDHTVDVREIRYGDHALLDTSMLRFDPADMDDKFTINWHITELGTSFGGELAPAGLPDSGAAGVASLTQLAPPALFTGTQAFNRFHPQSTDEQTRIEETRIATQVVSTEMPPPNELGGGILEPNLKPDHETFAQIAVGRSGDPAEGGTPDPVVPTDAQVAGASAVKQIHDRLLDPDKPPVDPGLVTLMRTRDSLPIPALAGDANVGVAVANAEASVSRRGLRVAPGAGVSIALTNLDGVERDVVIRELRNRSAVESKEQGLGVLSWGAFTTDVVQTVHLDAAMTEPQIVTVTPDPSAYTLWIGDMKGGDQAGTAIELDRGPRQQSLELGLGPVKPLHEARDKAGNMWVTLANSDEVVRLSNVGGSLADAKVDHFPIPGGVVADPLPPNQPPTPVLGPGDIAIDHHGIVWVTLVEANAIARIDPAKVVPSSTDGPGIDITPLKACTDATCRPAPLPVAAAAPLSRLPLQMKVRSDSAGNTELFFTEQAADAIGALRMSPSGKKLDEQHFNCVCLQPLGIALDPNGEIWYSEGTSNRIGRMTLDLEKPFSPIPAKLRHYNIPNPVQEFVPGGQPTPPCGGAGQPACKPAQPLPNPALTTLPHSVALDRQGRVWYAGEASETIGCLDPEKATPNTTDGFVDTLGPENEFGRTLAPADLAIDAAGTAWIADEYGDQIATAKVAADGSIDARFGFRPTGRNSLTDSPFVDPDGNLWFIEGGANLITRISGVAAPTPLADVLTAPKPPAPKPTPAQPQSPPPSVGGGSPAPVPATPGPATAPAKPQAGTDVACDTRRWLTRKGSGRKARRTLPLLGMKAAEVRRCLGRPAEQKRTDGAETWTYRGLQLEISRGRVIAFTLLRAGMRSNPDGAEVGARVDSFRKALGALVRTRGGGYRGVVAVGRRDAADVRVTVRRGRVTRVTVALTAQSRLDRAGRALLRRAR